MDDEATSRQNTVGGCQSRTGSRTNTSGRGAMHVWMRVCGNTKKGPRGGENLRNAGRWEKSRKGRKWRLEKIGGGEEKRKEWRGGRKEGKWEMGEKGK